MKRNFDSVPGRGQTASLLFDCPQLTSLNPVRFYLLPLLVLLCCLAPGLKLAAGVEPLFGLGYCVDDLDACEEPSDDSLVCYGPGGCAPRKTLFQWSHCATFEGGPRGMDEPLVTDRPDFTEASTTVGRGVAQFEFGYTYTYDNDGTTQTRSHSSPEVLLRYGILAEWLELRVAYNYGDVLETPGAGPATVQNGSEDLYLGFKIALTPQAGLLPEMALIPQMTVPSGDADQTNGEVLPGVNWVYSWEVCDFISTGGSSQYNRALDEATSAAYGEFAQSWTIAYTLTERFGAYTEWFALVPDGADTARTEHYLNGGFTFLVNNDIQLDIRAGVGANEAADDYFLGSGMSVRF